MQSKYLLTIAAMMLIITGCAGKDGIVEREIIDDCRFPDDGLTDAPVWICSETLENLKLSAVGNYEKTSAGLNFQKQQAMAAARVQLAQTMQVNVTNMVKNFAETTGFGDTETVDRVASTTSKLITNQNLTGSKLYRQAKNPETGALFVLVGMGDEQLDKVLNEIIGRSYNSSGNAKADWEKVQADKSFDELKEEIKDSYPAAPLATE